MSGKKTSCFEHLASHEPADDTSQTNLLPRDYWTHVVEVGPNRKTHSGLRSLTIAARGKLSTGSHPSLQQGRVIKNNPKSSAGFDPICSNRFFTIHVMSLFELFCCDAAPEGAGGVSDSQRTGVKPKDSFQIWTKQAAFVCNMRWLSGVATVSAPPGVHLRK